MVQGIAHSTNLFRENEQHKNINEVFIPQTSISIAEPVDVQIDEPGNDIIQVYQFISIISGEKVPGSESILNYMNKNSFSKDDPAINEHHYRISKKQYNGETHNIYNVDKTKTFNIKGSRCTGEHYYNKKQI